MYQNIWAQTDCVDYGCDNLQWLDAIIQEINDPINNPPMGGCIPSDVIQQCDYKGQTVIVYRPGSCIIADLRNRVFDCSGNFLFGFGGFCFTPDGPCPGDIEAAFINSCEVLYRYGDDAIAANCNDLVIPTLSQWSLIALGIIFMIFAVVTLKSKSTHSQLNIKHKA